MRQKVAKELRRLAFNQWSVLSPEYKGVITVRSIYRDLKKEMKNEKRR